MKDLLIQSPAPQRPGTGAVVARDPDFSAHVSRVAWAAGGILFLGSLLDIGILWILQRQSVPQWEFIAVTRTAEALPVVILSLGLFYGALLVRGSRSLVAYRLLAIGLICVGLAGGTLGLLGVTNYFVLVGSVSGEAFEAFRSTVLKASTLSLMYLVILVPIGIIGLRRPRK